MRNEDERKHSIFARVDRDLDFPFRPVNFVVRFSKINNKRLFLKFESLCKIFDDQNISKFSLNHGRDINSIWVEFDKFDILTPIFEAINGYDLQTINYKRAENKSEPIYVETNLEKLKLRCKSELEIRKKNLKVATPA